MQPGAPGEPSRKLTPEEAAKIESIEPTEADIQFMQDMIHHHAQAIEMTDWVPSRADSRSVKLIAQRMELSQEAEIELMERWLKAQGVEPPSDHADHGGTADAGDAHRRRRWTGSRPATGAAFDRLFLRYMTQHHRGALHDGPRAARVRRRPAVGDRQVRARGRDRSGDRDPADAGPA